jgi:hypothetical protein
MKAILFSILMLLTSIANASQYRLHMFAEAGLELVSANYCTPTQEGIEAGIEDYEYPMACFVVVKDGAIYTLWVDPNDQEKHVLQVSAYAENGEDIIMVEPGSLLPSI